MAGLTWSPRIKVSVAAAVVTAGLATAGGMSGMAISALGGQSPLTTGALGVTLIVLAVLWPSHQSMRQVPRLAAAMTRIADGDLDVTVPYADQDDAIGEMARAIEVLKASAMERIKLGVEQAEKADAQIANLSQAASGIGDISRLITAISDQTNQALSATVEAARAGESGRGFAVVAEDVKLLAARTAKATDRIRAQIAGMQNAAQSSVVAIKDIGTTIGRMSGSAAAFASAMERRGLAAGEIAQSDQPARDRTLQVARDITNIIRAVREPGSASSLVLAPARSLSAEGSKQRTEIARLQTTVHAA
jgi:methyl-accepting chemotaxis protein